MSRKPSGHEEPGHEEPCETSDRTRSRRASRAGFGRWTVAAILALATACGTPRVGGSGRLEPPGPEGVRRLVLEGSPYEMGWWHGRLLGAEIRELHPAWGEAVVRHGRSPEEARALQEGAATLAAQALPRLPETLRQEIEGMAEGAGLAPADLLRTPLLRSASRWQAEGVPLLSGTLALEAAGREGHPVATVCWSGPEAALLEAGGTQGTPGAKAGAWVLVERRPDRGPTTRLLAWPGALGGVAGAGEGGLAFLAVAAGAPADHQAMGLSFEMRARRALEEATGAADLLARLERTTAWRVLALDLRRDAALLGLSGLVASDPLDVSDRAAFAWPAEGERLHEGEAPALPPGGPHAAGPCEGPRLRLEGRPGGWDLRFEARRAR